MSVTLTRRSFLSASLLALCVPTKFFAEEPNEVVLRFAALSDVHFDKSHNEKSAERVRLQKALRFMNDYSAKQTYDKFDALLVAGDFSNHGLIEEIGPFKQILDENLKPSTRRVLCMGNHEYYGGNRELWEKTFQTEANRRQEINGYQFITISPDKGSCNENDYVYLRSWLDQNLKEAVEADPTKPVFVIQHYHVYNTVYGSNDLPGDFHAGVKDITDVLSKYPQVVHISGHSHIPSFDPRAIWQGDFTAIGTGSMSYFALMLYERQRKFQLGANVPYQQAGTFLIFDVYKDNTIRVRLYDTISNSFLDREYLLVDPINVDKYVYTNDRFAESSNPTWPQNASVELIESGPTAVSIRFDQGQDKNCVVSYRIEAQTFKNDVWENYDVYNVWSDFFMKVPAEKIDFEIFGLTPQTKYRLNVYAVSAFQKETPQPLSIEFETMTESNKIDRTDPNPRGNFLDVVFDPQKGPINVAANARSSFAVKKLGSPNIIQDETLGSAASFNGADQCFLLPYSGVAVSAFNESEISAVVKFRLDLSKYATKDPISVFGSTESGGLGFEYYVESKTLMTRCWIGDKYQDLKASFDGQGDAVAVFTYDGKEIKLYLNGKLLAKAACSGKFRFTNDMSARAFAIGADVCPGMGGRWFFPGIVSNVRIYTYALSLEQVEAIVK